MNQLHPSARLAFDVLGFIGLYALVDSDIFEKSSPKAVKRASVIQKSVEILSKEDVYVHKQVEAAAQQLLTINLLKSSKKKINKRDWTEFLEKIFSPIPIEELQSIRLIDKAPLLRNKHLETFLSEEVDEILSFKCVSPQNIEASDSPLLQHPLTQILCLVSELHHKHMILNDRYSQNMANINHQYDIVHAERFSPDEALGEERKKALIKITTIASFFYLSSKAFLGMKADVPILHSFLRRSVQVSEGVWEKRPSLLRFSGRRLLGLLVFPIAWGVMNWNDEIIKKSGLTDWFYGAEVAEYLRNSSQSIPLNPRDPPIIPYTPKVSLSAPISSVTNFIHHYDQSVVNEARRRRLTSQVIPTQRPASWMGAEVEKPITVERAKISLFWQPFSDAIIFYGFFLKHLLSYINPALAHVITVLAYTFSTLGGNERPDIINVLQNLPPYESMASFATRGLIQQCLFHVSGGSLLLPFALDVIHRTRYFLLKEMLFSLPVYPIDLSLLSRALLITASSVSGVVARLPPKQAYFDWNQLLLNLLPAAVYPTPQRLTLHPIVEKEVPNAKEIIHQVSKDIFKLYSSDHQTLSHADLHNCIVRLENYKKHFLPADKTLPLYFVDETVVMRLLTVISPERLERISEEREASSKSPPSAYELLIGHDNERGKEFTDRSSYMKIMQPALSEMPLNDFINAIFNPSSLSHERKGNTSASSTMISALQENHLQAAFPFIARHYSDVIRINYPAGRLTQAEFEHFFRSYLNTIEPHTLIEELKKMEQAVNKENREAQGKQSDEKKTTNNLYAHMRYYEDLQVNGIKKKEELLDIIQEFYSSIMKADEMIINGMEPMLLYELQASLLGRSVSLFEGISPYISPQSPEFINDLSELGRFMVLRKQKFVNDLRPALFVHRIRYLESTLYQHGLTMSSLTDLIDKYSAVYPDVLEVVREWDCYFDPTPLRRQGNDVVPSIQYANSNNYPERLKKLLIKDDNDVVRKIIYDDVTVGRMSSLKNQTPMAK